MQIYPGIMLSEAEVREAGELYKDLHRHPELSMQEHRTASVIDDYLAALGIESFRCGGTGVVGVIRNGDGPTVAFRADTDGLPLKEETGLPYASNDTGILPDGTIVPVMHGCGHDVHITAALITARILATHRELWGGTVVLLFQPGEETAAGAKAMVSDGLWLRAPRPEVVFGQHVIPTPTGVVGTREENFMSLADSWRVRVTGRGAHGSQPQLSVDPVVAAAHMVVRLQTVVSRESNPQQAVVVTIGTFHAGLKENIIPAEAEFTVNVRTPDEETRERVLDAVRRIIRSEAAASNAPEPSIEEISRFPRCWNDPDATKHLVRAFAEHLGETGVSETLPLMGSEDFGWLADSIGVPSVYWSFGGYNPDAFDGTEPPPGNHSPQFGPELDGTVATGIRAATVAILSRLGLR